MDAIISEIIKKRKQGIDCTEAESAEIKGWLRQLNIPKSEQQTLYDIQEYFSQEYGEYLDE
jgi:hypothetical protein